MKYVGFFLLTLVDYLLVIFTLYMKIVRSCWTWGWLNFYLQVDMLQEENEIVLEKVQRLFTKIIFHENKLLSSVFITVCSWLQLHRAEEMREAAEARARELEKQVLIQLLSLVYLCWICFLSFERKLFWTCLHYLNNSNWN